jgi:nicotinate-nucleotide adenylyltransferase
LAGGVTGGTNSSRPCIALLGGSFDPVHLGHVALAELFARLLRPDELRILPVGKPWQKASGLQAGDNERIAMLELAFAHLQGVMIDRREILRTTPTYTVETLRELRAELGPDTSIVFLMGADQLGNLNSWRDWESLFDLANFGVAARPGYRLDAQALPPPVAAALAARRAAPEQVRDSAAGRVCVAETLAVDISATQVRAALHAGVENGTKHGAGAGIDVRALVAPQVLDYIQQHNLYKI